MEKVLSYSGRKSQALLRVWYSQYQFWWQIVEGKAICWRDGGGNDINSSSAVFPYVAWVWTVIAEITPVQFLDCRMLNLSPDLNLASSPRSGSCQRNMLGWGMFLFPCFDRGEKTLPKSSPQSWLRTRSLREPHCKEKWGEVSSFLFSLLCPRVGPQTNPVQGPGERQKRLEEVTSPMQERWILVQRALRGPDLASNCDSPIGTSKIHAASTGKLMLQMGI